MSFRLFVLAALLFVALPLCAATSLLTFASGGCFEGRTEHADTMVADLTARKPSVAVITDIVGASEDDLKTFAKRYGHTAAVLSRAAGRTVAVTSAEPITVIADCPPLLYVTVGKQPLIAVQFSPYGTTHRHEEARRVVAYITKNNLLNTCPVIGDLETLSPADESTLVHFPGSAKRAGGGPGIAMADIDYTPYAILMHAGLYDALPDFVPAEERLADAKKEPLAPEVSPARAGLRTAHILMSADLRLRQTGAEILTSDKTNAYTETLPVSVTLD